MSEMVERVAQALSQVTYLGGAPVPFDSRDEKSKDWLRRLAVRAIETIREPSPDMLEMADLITPSGFRWCRESGMHGCEEIWRAMVAQALA